YTALQMEAAAIRRRLPDVDLHVIGLRATSLPDRPPQGGICILAGFAGALDPALKVGDVVIDSQMNDPIDSALAPVPVRTGAIFTAVEPVLSAPHKAELYRTSHALAVDMEQSIVRRFLETRHVPL